MPVTYDSKFHLDNIVDKYGKDLNAENVKPIFLMALILILIGMFINRVGSSRN